VLDESKVPEAEQKALVDIVGPTRVDMVMVEDVPAERKAG